MATSPIYSWPEPDNTDLVKNGALAIRTLGNAIDTTMGTMVAKTIIDAKGDLIAGTAADTAARLAVGNNGETLVADSSTSTGLRYQAPVNANPVLNSAFQVWQRGTSFSLAASAPAFTADRWYVSNSTNQAVTISRQATGDTTNLPNIQYALRFQRNSGQTGTTDLYLFNNFESINSIPYAGKTITFSFYARKGANYSATSSILSGFINTGTGTDQGVFSYSGAASVANVDATLTTTWQRFTATGTVGTNVSQMEVVFKFPPIGTAGAADYFEVTGVQIEVGSVATPFKTYAGTIQGELAACQRYYYRSTSSAGSQTAIGITGITNSTTNLVGYFNPPVPMRVTPTAVEFSSIGTQTTGSGLTAISAVAIVNESTNSSVSMNMTSSGFTANLFGLVRGTTGTGYIGLSAEL